MAWILDIERPVRTFRASSHRVITDADPTSDQMHFECNRSLARTLATKRIWAPHPRFSSRSHCWPTGRQEPTAKVAASKLAWPQRYRAASCAHPRVRRGLADTRRLGCRD